MNHEIFFTMTNFFHSSIISRSWNKRKTHSWKSIFQRGERRSNNNIKSKFISNPIAAKESSTKSEIKETIKVLPVIKSAGNSNNSSFKEKTKLTKSEFL